LQEASRAIRKKLKYGNVHRQLRALVILRALTENAGKGFQLNWADEMLMDRLKTMANDVCFSSLPDLALSSVCPVAVRGWLLGREQGGSAAIWWMEHEARESDTARICDRKCWELASPLSGQTDGTESPSVFVPTTWSV
jgi:hypothetical protein